MNHFQICPICDAHVNVNLSHCPVCGGFMIEQPMKHLTKDYPQPNYSKIASTKNKQAYFIFLSLTLLLIFLLVFFNFALPNWSFTWTITAITLLLYIWILITNTILSQITVGGKLVWQSIASSIVLASLNFAMTPHDLWFTMYALPLILIGSTMSLLLVILFGIRQPRDDYRFLILFILLNYSYTILSIAQIILFSMWMGYVTFAIGTLSMLGILTLGRKSFIRFIRSWLHI